VWPMTLNDKIIFCLLNKKTMAYIMKDPPTAEWLFGNSQSSWIWLLVRLYLGYVWLVAGWAKVGTDAWTGASAGKALGGFVAGALQKTGGAHPDVQSWYAAFLQNAVQTNPQFWSYLVAYGELFVGVALILGVLTGIAAFFGAFMNMNYLLAGTVSVNPQMFVLSIILILAWKVAGYLGADRYLLPMFGTPWRPRKIFAS